MEGYRRAEYVITIRLWGPRGGFPIQRRAWEKDGKYYIKYQKKIWNVTDEYLAHEKQQNLLRGKRYWPA